MSDLARAIQDLVKKSLNESTNVIIGTVVDYDHDTRKVAVQLSNPGNTGEIQMLNRVLPRVGTGLIPGQVNIGDLATLVCPMGDYKHAQVIAIKPKDNDFVREEEVSQTYVPRSGKIGTVSGRLGYGKSVA